MAGKIMGITVQLEGKTSGLTKSLSEADRAIAKTSSALRDVNNALKLDPTNTELLAQKQELLAKQIQQTSDRLEIMGQVAEDANEALARGDISQEQYASLTAEISKTNSALSGLNSEAQANEDALNGVGEGAEETAVELEKVEEESGSVGTALGVLKGTAEVVGGAMAAAFAAAVAAAKEVGEALVGSTMEASAYADELLTTSTITGISTEKLQELQYASELVDVSLDTLTGSMTKNLRAMDSAASGSGSAAEAYAKLGISVTDANGNLRDDEEVYWEVIDALGNITNETERDALAMDLLGKSAQDLNPLIEAGSDTMAELAQEAHDTGYVMSDETLGAFGDFDDQMQRFNNSTKNASNAMGTILLPLLGDLAGDGTDALNEFSKAIISSGGDIDKMGDAIGDILPDILDMLVKDIPKITGTISKMVTTIIDVIVDNLPAILDAAMKIVDSIAKTLLEPSNLEKIINGAMMILTTLVTYLIQNLPLIIEASMQIIVAIINGITQALPTLLPVIIEVLTQVVNTLIDNLPMLLESTLTLILAVAEAILENLGEIVNAVVEIITAVVGFLLSPEGIGLIVETGYQLLVALVESLPEALGAIMEGIGSIVDAILGAFEDMGEGINDVWEGIWDFIKGIINTIIGGINGMIYGVESAINFVIDAINTLSWDIPSWVPIIGGETFGFDIGHVSFGRIPELAAGAVIPPNNPFLAVLGDQQSGTNIEAPLDTIKQAVVEAMGCDFGGESQIVIPVYIGNERLDTIVASANARNSFISGGH